MDLSKYASALPYPDVEVEKNIAESKLLMPVYSGSTGELTAVTTYIFQTYVTPKYPEIQEALEGIAITEMLHHKLLGKPYTNLAVIPSWAHALTGTEVLRTIPYRLKNI